jgi:hypothetical protein
MYYHCMRPVFIFTKNIVILIFINRFGTFPVAAFTLSLTLLPHPFFITFWINDFLHIVPPTLSRTQELSSSQVQNIYHANTRPLCDLVDTYRHR